MSFTNLSLAIDRPSNFSMNGVQGPLLTNRDGTNHLDNNKPDSEAQFINGRPETEINNDLAHLTSKHNSTCSPGWICVLQGKVVLWQKKNNIVFQKHFFVNFYDLQSKFSPLEAIRQGCFQRCL